MPRFALRIIGRANIFMTTRALKTYFLMVRPNPKRAFYNPTYRGRA
jgi:hypothetical protein